LNLTSNTEGAIPQYEKTNTKTETGQQPPQSEATNTEGETQRTQQTTEIITAKTGKAIQTGHKTPGRNHQFINAHRVYN